MRTKLSRMNRTWLLAACAAIALAPTAVEAQSGKVRYSIGARDLGTALTEVARQSNREIYFPADLTRGMRAPALNGEMTLEQALERLLQRTGLNYRLNSNGAVVIERASGEGVAGSAAAEDESADIVITGSRIRGRYNEASPTVTLDRAYIEQTGATTVEDVMRTLPQNSTFGTNEFAAAVSSSRNGSLANLSGGTGLNLRGLGNSSTLVLVEGRRLAPGGVGEFIDISTFPLSAIERVEVVPDGASAIYGSDAVGGVVNFILRNDFRGAETSARYALTTEGSLRRYGASQLFGFGNQDDSLMIVADYSRHEPLLTSERPFASGFGAGQLAWLTLDSERGGITTTFEKRLGADLRLTGMGIANIREVESLTFHPTQLRTVQFEGRTREASGTLGVEWDVTVDWRARAAMTYSHSRSHRENFMPATATLPVFDTEVIAKQDLWITTADVEGPVFQLPGGAARLAAGIEHRREGQHVLRRRDGGDGPSSAPISRNVNAGFAELFLPLVGPGNAGALGQRLELTGAVRIEDYSDVGTTENFKLGAVFQPIGGLSFRATYGTSFRAPLLFNFDDTNGAAFTFSVPTANGTIPTLFVISVPASDLGPETATTWSAGFDLTPQNLAGFSANFTYYDINYRDRITSSPTSLTLFVDPLLQPLISMPPDPELVALVPQLTFVPLTPVPLSQMQASFDGRTRNQARTRMRGIDLIVNKDTPVGSGNLSLGFNASYIIDLVYQQIESVPGVSVVDTIFNPTDLKVRGHAAWSGSNFTLAGAVNYLDGYTDNQLPTATVRIPSMTTVDLSASYRFTQGWMNGLTLRAAVSNLFNEYPPPIIDRRSSYGNPGFDTQNHSPLGRILSFEVIKQW